MSVAIINRSSTRKVPWTWLLTISLFWFSAFFLDRSSFRNQCCTRVAGPYTNNLNAAYYHSMFNHPILTITNVSPHLLINMFILYFSGQDRQTLVGRVIPYILLRKVLPDSEDQILDGWRRADSYLWSLIISQSQSHTTTMDPALDGCGANESGVAKWTDPSSTNQKRPLNVLSMFPSMLICFLARAQEYILFYWSCVLRRVELLLSALCLAWLNARSNVRHAIPRHESTVVYSALGRPSSMEVTGKNHVSIICTAIDVAVIISQHPMLLLPLVFFLNCGPSPGLFGLEDLISGLFFCSVRTISLLLKLECFL